MSKFDRVCPWADPYSGTITLIFKVSEGAGIQSSPEATFNRLDVIRSAVGQAVNCC